MSENRFGWVGATDGFEPLLAGLSGTIWTDGELPDGWVTRSSPAEAASGADFIFVSALDPRALLAKGVTANAPPGSCVVLTGSVNFVSAAAIAAELDDAGLDMMDMALLPSPDRLAFGGDRDTFNLLKPDLAAYGKPFFCGAHGAGLHAAAIERRLLAGEGDLRAIVPDAEARGFYPQALRNVLKAGPLSSPDFDAELDRLTTRP